MSGALPLQVTELRRLLGQGQDALLAHRVLGVDDVLIGIVCGMFEHHLTLLWIASVA